MNHVNRPCFALVWVVAAALLLAACDAPPKAGDRPGDGIPGGDVAQPDASSKPEHYAAAKLMPLRDWSGVYQASSPPDAPPANVPFTLATGDGGQWRWQFPKRHEVWLNTGKDGALVIETDIDHTQLAHVAYDPPMTKLPPKLMAGQTYEGESRMVVTHSTTGAARDEGTCRYTVEWVESRRVITPAGTFDAVVVRMTRSIKLNLAQVEVTIDTAYAPGVGMVAEHTDRYTKALGLFGVRRLERMLLSEPKP